MRIWVFKSPQMYWEHAEADKPIAKEILGVDFSVSDSYGSWTLLAEDFIIDRRV